MSLIDTLPDTQQDREPEPPTSEVANSPMALIDRAHQLNADPAQVEKWMELAERWENRQAEKAYAQAMHACQKEMPVVVRDAENTQTRSRFAKKETVQKRIKETYSKHGFSISFGEADCPIQDYKRIVADVTHEAGHTRRYHFDLPIDGLGPKGAPIGGMNKVQGCMSTVSYGERRLICSIFNVTVADEDNDAQTDLKLVSEEQAIQLKEVIEQIEDKDARRKLVESGFKWVEQMTGATPKRLTEIPAIAFAGFRDIAIQHAEKARGA